MGNDDLGEEMAHRQNDRNGNAPLRRDADPDKVAAHLATGEGLIEPKKVDGFKSESPIRAFTDFQVAGNYAIGKGFRPSIAHLSRYLDAMHAKENWALVQVILPRDSDGDPTILFRKADLLAPPPFEALFPGGVPDAYEDLARELHNNPERSARAIGLSPALGMGYGTDKGDRIKHLPEDPDNPDQRPAIEREIDKAEVGDTFVPNADFKPTMEFAPDDPINPKHYDGWECGDIGERLSANGYQMLKYVWRLGKKDDPCKEIGKAIRYCEREIELIAVVPGLETVGANKAGIDAKTFLEDRITFEPVFTQNIARMLWAGYGRRRLQAIYEALCEHRFHLDCGRGLAI